jgi:hypothetical protein
MSNITDDGYETGNFFASPAGRAVARLAGSSHTWLLDSYPSEDHQYVTANLRFDVNNRQDIVIEIEAASCSDPADEPGPWLVIQVVVSVRPDQANQYRSGLEGDKIALAPTESELARLADRTYRAELAEASTGRAKPVRRTKRQR